MQATNESWAAPSRAGWLGPSILLVLVGLAVVGGLHSLWHPRTRGHIDCGQPPCLQRVRDLTLLLAHRGEERGWPPYGGTRFLLALVAHRDVDLRNPDNLEIFTCPAAGLDLPPPEAWARITLESLATQRFPGFSAFAGRRNDEAGFRLDEQTDLDHEPIVGFIHPRGPLVILGFANGRMQTYQPEDLGVPEGTPLVFGEGAPHPLLGKLAID